MVERCKARVLAAIPASPEGHSASADTSNAQSILLVERREARLFAAIPTSPEDVSAGADARGPQILPVEQRPTRCRSAGPGSLEDLPAEPARAAHRSSAESPR